MDCSFLKSQSGFSLIEVIIAIAISGILFVGMMTMQTNEVKLNSNLTQKMAKLDIERVVTGTLASGGVCTYLLGTVATPPAFDPTTVSTSPPAFKTINSIPVKGAAGAQPAVSVSATTPASGLSNQLYVSSITVTDFTCILPCTSLSSLFTANLTVGFDQSKLPQNLAPLKFPITVTTTGPAGSQTITGCIGTSGGASSGGANTNYTLTSTCHGVSGSATPMPDNGNGSWNGISCLASGVVDGTCNSCWIWVGCSGTMGTCHAGKAGSWTCTATGWQCVNPVMSYADGAPSGG